MKSTLRILVGVTLCALAGARPTPIMAQADDEIIRLRPSSSSSGTPAVDTPVPQTPIEVSGPRRGFDYSAFEARLESLWFQRKTLLADGRRADAAAQSQLIRAFCAEEGVQRVEGLASALVGESERRMKQGDYAGALESLELARSFDAERPDVALALAELSFRSGRGTLTAAAHLAASLRYAVVRAVRDLSLFNQLGLILVVSMVGCVGLFSLVMLARYQVPFRHEVGEWVGYALGDRWAAAAGWTLLFLPIVVWFAAGWIVLYWILITFRFMQRSEKLAAVGLLLLAALAVPGYRLGVTAYGMTADPVVRTTLASAGGEYDPDRILKLRRLVHAHPDDPVYRFLLAGLYKNGRYLEDAFAEYKEALELDPTFAPAHINLGNIFFATSQYSDAINSYNNAIAADPDSILAYFNRHMAQSEAFRFREAEETLEQAREVDPRALAELFAAAEPEGERRTPIDATLHIGSLWEAALAGGRTESALSGGARGDPLAPLANPVSVISLLTLLGCLAAVVIFGREPAARRCIRCGRPFCHRCKSSRQGHEYCSQCLHLFVVGDGLAPETKTRKLYEVERHERGARRARSLTALVLPGAAHLMRGRAVRGSVLVAAWLAALIAWRPSLLALPERMLGVELALEEVRLGGLTGGYAPHPVGLIGLAGVLVVWVGGNAWRWRRREV